MTAPLRVIALGQPAAGDDGVAFAVLDELRQRGVPPGVELVRASDAASLMPLLETPAPVVIVDAVLGPPAGQILDVEVADLAGPRVRSISSHGLGVAEAVALVRQLAPDRVSPVISVLAIGINLAGRPAIGLSAPVSASVARAADRILGRAKAG